MTASTTAAPAAGTLGTFAGVFTPSILTILGIILFLRLGYVVGGSGLEQALVVIAMANAISLLTSLSVAAISTNLKVKGGGDYYLISRTLGLGFGGAIGLVLFLAQSISVGFYCIGFAEAAAAALHWQNAFVVRLFAGAAVAALFILAWLGADWATRFQYLVMAAIGAALAVFVAGGLHTWNSDVLAANLAKPADGLPFWIAFAIFFPAVTGFTQGVSMSGDLARPAVSIPRGVLAAVFLSMVIYFGCAVLFAATLPGELLRTDYTAMKRVASVGSLIDAGVFAATLSSALASFLGAPRILQSLAKDDVFPLLKPFAQGSGATANPRRAMLLTAAVAVAIVALGDLNLIASLVSMFFLISYGMLNYATYLEARSDSPSFRPTFRLYHPRVGLLGAAACLGAMLAIDPLAGAVAVAIMFTIYQYLKRRALPARWADSRRSHHLHEARMHLLAAAAETEHPRDWRPQLLVFSNDRSRRARLLRFASWIEGGSGLTTVVRILEGQGAKMLERREQALAELAEEIKAGEFSAFPLVVTGADLDRTISSVVQAAGIGPLRANTVVANWIAGSGAMVTPLGAEQFSRNLRTSFRLGCNLLILDADAREWETLDAVPPKQRVIDVWWREGKTGELSLLLGHLVRRSQAWEGSTIRVLTEAKENETEEQATARLGAALEEYRIDADIVVTAIDAEKIAAQSHASSLVFLPFGIHGGRFYGPAGGEVMELLKALPIVVLVMAAQDVDLAADPDETIEAAGAADAAPTEGAKEANVEAK
jgi:amino acid transporter